MHRAPWCCLLRTQLPLPRLLLQSSDQKRQAFSKRKRGLVLKSYQLYKLTDAKVSLVNCAQRPQGIHCWACCTRGNRTDRLLCCSQVFMFVVNDKGSSWAYASPGFGQCLSPGHLKMLREYAKLPSVPKTGTEVSYAAVEAPGRVPPACIWSCA